MKKIILSMLMILALGVWSQDNQETSDPKELTQARTVFQNQMKVATSPVIQKYLQTLDALKKQLGGKGDAAGAMAVQKEMDSLKAEDKKDTTKDTPAQKTIKLLVSAKWLRHSGRTI